MMLFSYNSPIQSVYSCFIRILERIDSYAIRLVSLLESERFSPPPLQKSCWKKFGLKQKAYPIQYKYWNVVMETYN